nr:cytochrome P450 [Nocardia donostiensis]
MVPVEIWPGFDATLVISYNTAKNILSDSTRFSADPRRWQATLSPEQLAAPIMPMIEYRPNALRSDGEEHRRYRTATLDALEKVDLGAVRRSVERIAVQRINQFIERGEADLLKDYAAPLTFEVLNEIVGCPAHIGREVAAASSALFEGVDTATVNIMFDEAFTGLAHLKKVVPGDDVTTRLLEHGAGLSDVEMVHQLVTCYSAGHEIPTNLIANTLYLMMTDPRFITTRDSSQLMTRTALLETLANEPPLANYCITYPRGPVVVENIGDQSVWLPADQPVITSMAACTTNPDVNTGDFADGRWNLAWGTGPHTCPEPAQKIAELTAHEAIDFLFDAVPDVEPNFPANQMLWRPGPFHRALAALPVKFPPAVPITYFG